MAVESLIANMEVAAEMDIAANEDGKPAVHKIKQLAEVEDKVSQSVLHRELLDAGILGAMKLWIELMPDGSLPNVKVKFLTFCNGNEIKICVCSILICLVAMHVIILRRLSPLPLVILQEADGDITPFLYPIRRCEGLCLFLLMFLRPSLPCWKLK